MKQAIRKKTEHLPKNTAKSLARQLQLMAVEKGPDYKLPTTRELCMRFSTGPATLNDALAMLEAQNFIYRKPRSGIFVSPKLNCKNIHVLINASLVDGESVSPFWGILWGKLVKEGQKRAAHKNEEIHYQLVACDPDVADLLPPDMVRSIESGHIHGVLSIGMDDPTGYWTLGSEIPMVAYAGPGHWQVGIYEDHIITEGIRRLAAEGCERIAYWCHFGYWRHRERHRIAAEDEFSNGGKDNEFLQTALAANGLPYYPGLFRTGGISPGEIEGDFVEALRSMSSESYQEQGYLSAMRAFAPGQPVKPDGLVIADDMLTSGAIVALQEMGIRPGIDVKIVSHSNIGSPLLYKWEHKLILYRTDASEIVAAMFDLLDRLMTGERPDPPIVQVPLRFQEESDFGGGKAVLHLPNPNPLLQKEEGAGNTPEQRRA